MIDIKMLGCQVLCCHHLSILKSTAFWRCDCNVTWLLSGTVWIQSGGGWVLHLCNTFSEV